MNDWPEIQEWRTNLAAPIVEREPEAYRYTINIASIDQSGDPITEAYRLAARDYVLRRFSNLFGGASCYQSVVLAGVGAWNDDLGRTVREQGWYIVTYADHVDARADRVRRTVQRYLRQDSVMLACEPIPADAVTF